MSLQNTLPSLRVREKTSNKMDAALNKINEGSLIKISKNHYRRLCYEHLSEMILSGKEQISVSIR